MASVKKPIKIYARLKPTDFPICNFEIDKHINDDGSTDDILILNSTVMEEYSSSMPVNRPEAYKFRYSKVFDGDSTQDELFDEICQPVLESALQGYNSTIFAYGQTGSGKTFTMTGSRHQWKNRGIIPRSLSYIFDKFNELTDQGFIASAFLSYLEIYNENGYDLLHSGFSSGRIEDLKKVQLLEDAQQQIHMKNLTVHPIKSEDEAMQLLYLGDHNRIIAETPMNEASTRSHCIFTIHINIRECDSSTVRRSKVHLVDLAGSERLANSNSTGQLFHEARHINLALHYLEQVIVALGEAHRSHIPYRNSMMTSILRDSLGGNCMTSMIATLSLEHRNIMESLSTCRFSQRVALVTNAAILNEETDPMLLIAQLKTENKRLKDIISNSSIKQLEQNSDPLSQEEVADCWKLVEKFISENDEEAILPIPPDMRMVQTCFRCLKMAVQMNKDDILGITSNNGSPSFKLKDPPTSFLDDHAEMSSKYSSDMTREQLLEALRTRDAEIDVLTKMLKPQKKITSRSTKNDCHSIANSNFEHGDGPIKFPIERKYSEKMRSDLSDFEEHIEKPTTAYQKMTINHHQDDTSQQQQLPFSSRRDFDSESLLIEGLSETKKEALDSFVRSYKGRDKLENVRDSLLTKRNEREMLESLLDRNYANHKNLQMVLMNSDVGDDRAFIQEAIESQAKSIENQNVQLKDIEQEMKIIEGKLKRIYAQLMQDFERHWMSMKDIREKTMFIDPDSESKPFSEVTKGIVKGVGGQSPRCRSNNSHIIMPMKKNETKSNEFYVSPPAHISSSYYSPRTVAKKSSGRRKKSGRKSSGDRTPRNLASCQEEQSQTKAKHPKGPPATPNAASSASATLELLHHHNRNEFPTNSADNFYEMDIANFDADKDDEELIKGLPMTGDATIDQEILAFFRTRQAVFKRINSDKSNKLSPQNEQCQQQQKQLYQQYHNDGSLTIPQY